MRKGINVVPMTLFGHEVEVEYFYYPGEAEVHTEPNGDPGTPGYGPSVEVYHVWYNTMDRIGNIVSVEVKDLLEEDFEERILETHEE